ncbi:MAG: hypothetical protein JXQ30_07680 [Spirochaetes bacterium]|nr:hypothetical protein [Spirochaetota bacterium]
MKKDSYVIVIFTIMITLFFMSGCGEGENTPTEEVFLPSGDLVFVCGTRGDDSNPGTAEEPMKTIQAAIDYADTQYIAAAVIVAEGTYSKDFNADGSPVVMLKEGISLYGGYSSDFSERDTAVHETILEDTSSGGGTIGNPNRAVEGDGSVTAITNTTIIDGFSIKGGGGDHSSAIFNTSGSAQTIQNSEINGGSGDIYSYGISNLASDPLVQYNVIDGGNAPDRAHGIYNSSSSPTIQYNAILGGDDPVSVRTFGIFNDSGSGPTIRNNAIDGGIGAPSYGIRSESSSSPTIVNNTVHGGTVGNCYAINDVSSTSIIRNNTVIVGGAASSNTYLVCLALGSGTIIENNILITSGGTNRYGIFEESSNADPASVRNNDIYHVGSGSTLALYYDADGGGLIMDIVTMENDLQVEGKTTGGNVTIDPQFATGSSDGLHLSGSSPDSVTKEGLNGAHSSESWGYTVDKNGTQRSPLDDSSTEGWSMGAYEY